MANGDKDKVKSDKDKVKERKLNFKKERDSAVAKGKKMNADFAAKCKAFKKANPGKQCRDMKFNNSLTPTERDLFNRYGRKGNTVQLSEQGKKETDERLSKDVNTPKKS